MTTKPENDNVIWVLFSNGQYCSAFLSKPEPNFYEHYEIVEYIPKATLDLTNVLLNEYRENKKLNQIFIDELQKQNEILREGLAAVKVQLENTGGLEDIEDRGDMLQWLNKALSQTKEKK